VADTGNLNAGASCADEGLQRPIRADCFQGGCQRTGGVGQLVGDLTTDVLGALRALACTRLNRSVSNKEVCHCYHRWGKRVFLKQGRLVIFGPELGTESDIS